jgi:hypothetical protein
MTRSTRTAYATSATNPGKSSLAAKLYFWRSILEQPAQGLRDTVVVENPLDLPPRRITGHCGGLDRRSADGLNPAGGAEV